MPREKGHHTKDKSKATTLRWSCIYRLSALSEVLSAAKSAVRAIFICLVNSHSSGVAVNLLDSSEKIAIVQMALLLRLRYARACRLPS
jgi:hypothetical protein